MNKKTSLYLSTGLILVAVFVFSYHFVENQFIQASTFVPCDPYDALCNLDCDLEGGVCGQWINDATPTPDCPAGQIIHPTAGTCIYGSDATCRSVYGSAYYDGNQYDGCSCVEGAVYNQGTGLCELPGCPAGQIMHPTAGTCIYDSDATCRSVYGSAYYDGNQYDGCSCVEGAVYNQGTGLCELPGCPAGQVMHPTAGTCIYDSDATCRSVYGSAYYDGNQYDGCSCVEGAVYNQGTGLCELPGCPAGQMMHPVYETCIYDSDASCQAVYGAAYYDGNQYDGCSCVEGAVYNQGTGLCELPGCPAGQMMHPVSETCIYDSDASCQAVYGAAYYDGNQYDGCSCVEGATYNQGTGLCEMPSGEIVLSEKVFHLPADGESTKEISAWVENSQGEVQNVEMWIKLQTPNNISPGTLDIYSGIKGNNDTSVSALYTAPKIPMTEKTENADVIEDLIYVFAMINGEQKYKVIEAIVEAEGEDFQVELTFEKPGLETKTYTTTFNQGALTGDLHLMSEGEKYPLSDVKISLHGTYPDADKEEINLETYSEDGYFFFENLGETGEDDIGDIEMEISGEAMQMYNKTYQHGDKFKARTTKYGANDIGQKYITVADNFFDSISDADFEDAEKEVKALRQSAFTLYFLEYYSSKADESLSNFKSYMQNIIKETLGLVQGFVNVTGGLFDAAEGKDGLLSKVFTIWSKTSSTDSTFTRMVRNTLDLVIDGLRQGVKYGGKDTQRYMSYLKELMGGLEQYLFGETINAKEAELEKTILGRFDNYLKSSYLSEVEKIVNSYTVNPDNIPDDFESYVKRAEETFKENTEKHVYRNELQYEWDVDTAAVNELVNVLKPATKMGLTLYMANPVAANELVDKAGHAFNAMKVLAAANHTYEWYILYRDDLWALERSLNILYKGQDLAWTPEESTNSTFYVYEEENIGPMTARAEVQKLTFSVVYNNIAIAVENQDEEALKSALEDLEELKESESTVRENNSEYLTENFSEEENKQEKFLETIALNDSFDFELDLMDLRILTLALDQSAENLQTFTENVSEFEEKEIELNEKTTELLTVAENAESKTGNGDIIFAIFFIIAAIVLTAGIVKGIIFIKNHKIKLGVLMLIGAILLAFILLIIGALFIEDELTESEASDLTTIVSPV